MDDYFSWVEPIFYALLVIIYIFSLFKNSFEYITSKEIAALKGKCRRSVERLHFNNDKTLISLNGFITILIVLATVIGSILFFVLFLPHFNDGVYLLVLSIVITILASLFIATHLLPFLSSFLRFKIFAITPFVKLIIIFMSPITVMVYKLRTIAFNIESYGNSSISMDELSDAVEIVSKASTPEDKRILTGMARFANADVSDIMSHRVDMSALSSTATYKEVLEMVKETGFSRIPVYTDVLDNIIGILYVKDLIPKFDLTTFEWVSLIRKPYFVSDTKMINELLLQFQKKKIHLAIVIDEYGSTLGIVSLEDILEEIVGEIEDESDIDDPYYSKVDENTYIFEGKTALSDLFQVLDIPTSEIESIRGDAETLSGLIVAIRKDIPNVGDKARFKNYCLTIIKMENHRIESVKVERIDENIKNKE